MIQKKICMLGDFAVGKTSLVRRFVYEKFEDKYLSTIGVKVSRKEVRVTETEHINLLLWDLAGGEEFNGVQANYLKGAAGAIIVCDLTRKKTLPGFEKYAVRISDVSGGVPVLFVANKADLSEEFEISEDEIAEIADRHPSCAGYLLTSAKTGLNVDQTFLKLAQEILIQNSQANSRP